MPAGTQGLVYMKMGASTFTYHQDREKTEAAWADEMFTVGNIGYLDVAELPRDPNGKLYKRKLRDPYRTGRDRQI